MKKFKDLVFNMHPNTPYFDTQALCFFDNGFGVSVVTGDGAYGDYEMAILKGNEADWSLTYSTPVAEDVIGYLNPDSITSYMKQVQELPNINQPVIALPND